MFEIEETVAIHRSIEKTTDTGVRGEGLTRATDGGVWPSGQTPVADGVYTGVRPEGLTP